jgi:Ca2+-binding RTX toxin-like protein
MTLARLRVLVLVLVAAVGATAVLTLTASNTVPATNVGRQQLGIDANALKPAACAALNLTNLVVGTNGTAANDLILGPAAASNFNGNGGADCMVGGAGKDRFTGNGPKAGDVCIGNGGTDNFTKCTTAIQ